MVTKTDFQKIVIEFNLTISEKHNTIEENDTTYAKLPGVNGFLVAWDETKKTIIVDEDHINYVKMKYNYKSIDDMTVEEILEMLPDFKDVKLSDIYHPAKAA